MGALRFAAVALLVATLLVEALATPAAAAPPRGGEAVVRQSRAPGGWRRAIVRLVRGRQVGVAVREDGAFLFRDGDARRRTPASNEKLLLSMAILEALGPDARLLTTAAAPAPAAGVVPGNLWVAGSGDPAVDPRRLRSLARAIRDAGVVRIEGSVRGSTGYFKRDWGAPGWKPSFRRTQVALPTALTFEGNRAGGVHIRDPEVRAAKVLTDELKRLGVSVVGKPGAGKAPAGLTTVAEVRSRPLIELLEYMNRYSSNFFAEVLGKRLGAERAGAPGSIRKGAEAIRSWAASLGVRLRARDGSGLSYANRVSPNGLVRLLDEVEDRDWGEAFREALPEPGQGTLGGRMRHVRVHAKTGTLTNISALSGWVYLRQRGVWAEFSILSRGMSKSDAVRLEDRIVRILFRSAG